MEPIGPVLAIVRLGVVLGLLFLLPGIAIGPHLAPGAATPLAKIGRAAGIGLLAAVAGCTAVALLGLFRPTIVATVLAGLAILPLHADRPSWPRIAPRTRRWWAGVGVVGGLALAVSLVPAAVPSLTGSPGSPLMPVSWTGVPGALVLANGGALPAEFPAWNGVARIGPAELPAVAHLAAAIQLLPGDLPTRLAIYHVALTAATVLVGAGLLRRWLPTWPSLVAAGVFVGLAGGTGSGPAATLETPWVALTLLAVWLADRAIVERNARLLVTTALVGAAVGAARADLFLVAAAGIVGAAAGRLLVAPGGGPEAAGGLGHRYGRRLGLRRDLGRHALGSLTAAAVVVVLAAGAGSTGAGALTIIVPTGQVLGAVSDDGVEPPAASPHGPADERPDRTVAFARAVDPDMLVSTDGGPALASALLAVGPGGPTVGSVVLGGSTLAGLLAWPALDARRQRLVAALLGFGVVVAATGLLVLGADGPFGARRIALDTLLPMATLVPAAAVGLAATLAGVALRSRVAVGRLGRRATLAVPVIALALAGLAVGSVTLAGTSSPSTAPSADAVAAYRYLATSTPLDARVLVNGRTDGVVAALASRAGVLDGPEPDAHDDARLDRAAALASGARHAFAEPANRASTAFLARESVTHLLVGPALGSAAPFPVDLDALRAARGLVEVASFGDVHVFEVLPLEPLPGG